MEKEALEMYQKFHDINSTYQLILLAAVLGLAWLASVCIWKRKKKATMQKPGSRRTAHNPDHYKP